MVTNTNITPTQKRELTAQQQAVVDSDEKYLLVASCPGSGKSFTLRHMNPDGKSRDLKLSFARADAAALKDDSNNDKSVSTMDSLGWQTLIQNEKVSDVYDENSFLTDNELKRFAGLFYDGGWDELTSLMKPLNGNTKLHMAKKLREIYANYESTGKLPTSGKSSVLAANQYVEYMRSYVRNHGYIMNALDFADSEDWDRFIAMNYGSERNLLNKVQATKNELIRAYICFMLGITGKRHNKVRFKLREHYDSQLIFNLTKYIDCRPIINSIIMHLNDAGWSKLYDSYWLTGKAFTADTGWKMNNPDDRAAFQTDCIRMAMGAEPENRKMRKVFPAINHSEWKIDLTRPDYTKKSSSKDMTVKLNLDDPADRAEFRNRATASYAKSYLLGEISVEFLNLITDPDKPNILQPIIRNYDRILIDEGQDLSEVQADIINEFANQTDVRICIFYDGDQSMYGFRNAAGDLANRAGFLTNEKATRKVMHLSDNFRSTNDIIGIANEIRSHITNSSGTTITAARNTDSPEKPGLRIYASDKDEADAIIQWIKDIASIDTPIRKTPMRSIAIICRTGYMVKYLTDAINKYGAEHDTELFEDQQWNPATRKYDSVAAPLSARTENGTGVQVLTGHKSKGREYDAVWIPGLEKDSWPLKHDMGKKNLTASEYQEELRIFYVAVTRAKNRLMMSCARLRNPMALTSGADRPETHRPSSFLPVSTVNSQYQVFGKELVDISTVTESTKPAEQDAAANIMAILTKMTNAKWSNRMIQRAFNERIKELESEIEAMQANNADPDAIATVDMMRAQYVKKVERIKQCADAVKVGVFHGEHDDFESVTNYNRCRDRMCELDQNMTSLDNAERLQNALNLIEAASQQNQYAKLTFNKQPDQYPLSKIPLKYRKRTQKLAKRSARRPNPALKGMDYHRYLAFLTVTLPFNIPLSKMNDIVQNKRGTMEYNRIQQLTHAMNLALHPTRGTDWSKCVVNGYWTATEITVKSPIRQRPDGQWEPDESRRNEEPECHLHIHILLDLTAAYWNDNYRVTVDGKDKYDVGNYMQQGQNLGDDMAWHLRRSMISAGIPFAENQLPIVRLQMIPSGDAVVDGISPDGETGRTVYQEVTKYTTKLSIAFSCGNEHPVWPTRDDVKPYVFPEHRNKVIYTLNEVLKGLRIHLVYGTIKDALKLVDARKEELLNPQDPDEIKQYVCDDNTLQYHLVEEGKSTEQQIEQSSIAVSPLDPIDVSAIDEDVSEYAEQPDDDYDPYYVPDENPSDESDTPQNKHDDDIDPDSASEIDEIMELAE